MRKDYKIKAWGTEIYINLEWLQMRINKCTHVPHAFTCSIFSHFHLYKIFKKLLKIFLIRKWKYWSNILRKKFILFFLVHFKELFQSFLKKIMFRNNFFSFFFSLILIRLKDFLFLFLLQWSQCEFWLIIINFIVPLHG